MDVTVTDGTVYRVVCAHPVRNDADLAELQQDAMAMLDGPPVLLRPAGFSASAETHFVVLNPAAVTAIDLRQHEMAPDPLAVMWSWSNGGGRADGPAGR
jgi:hypothetical protein